MPAVKDQELNELIERRAKLETENADLRARVQMLGEERLDAIEAGVEVISDESECERLSQLKSMANPSEPIRLETEEVFDAELLHNPDPDPDPFQDDPMKILAKMMTDLKDMAMRPSLGILPDMPSLDHKVRIFRMDDRTILAEIEAQIEAFLSDGWRCHLPLVCKDFLIMDFSRRKESEEDGINV